MAWGSICWPRPFSSSRGSGPCGASFGGTVIEIDGEGEGLSGDQRQRNHSIRVDGNPRHLEGLRSIWHNFATGEEDVLLQWPNNHLLYARSTHDLPPILCLRLQCCFFHESTASSFFSATCSGQHLNSSSIFDPHVMAGFELYSGFC
uniref:Uncharacterized protein n=1 Tax=Oryza nivara TaxID=4536 RepID=A0A0E0GTV3_ORYNI